MKRVAVPLVILLGVAYGPAWVLGAEPRVTRDVSPGQLGGTGVSPVHGTHHGQDARATRDGSLPVPQAVNRWERVEGLPRRIAVFDTVFWEPEDTRRLREMIANGSAVRGKSVLEIGTGTGLLALCCLQAGAAKVVATDVNPAAVANAAYNARLLGAADRLDVRLVPLHRPEAYSVVGPSEKFDLILSNPPWENGRPESIDKYAYFDPDFKLLQSFLEGLEDHLSPGGVGVVSYGSVDAISTLQRLAPKFELAARAWDRRSLQGLPGVFLPGMLIEIVPQPVSPNGALPIPSVPSSTR